MAHPHYAIYLWNSEIYASQVTLTYLSVGQKIVTIVNFIIILVNTFFLQVLGICLAPTGSAVRNLIIHKYLAVAPAFQFLKVSVGHKIENVSVSHKIENVSVSHKIVI